MQQEPTEPTSMPETAPASPKRRRGAFITGAVLAVLVAGGFAVGLTPNHLGLPLPGTVNSAASNSTSDTQKTGCPSATTNATWSHPPTKTLQFTDATSVVTLHSGDTLQIDLPATDYRWTLTSITNTTVAAQSPAGYYNTANNTCDWRFAAQSSGTTLIKFLRRRNCAPKTICSDIQVDVPFTIQVS